MTKKIGNDKASVMFGVFDNEGFSARQAPADEVFDTLQDAFVYVADGIEVGHTKEALIMPVKYSEKRGLWYPDGVGRAIVVDGSNFDIGD